jgi:chitin disaccharide deacetylase
MVRSICATTLTLLLSATALAIHPPSQDVLSGPRAPSLAVRLGYSAQDKLLIVNSDDLGMSHAINTASIDAIEHGLVTSATIMVPCPWFPEIAAYAKANPSRDFGVHLTYTSEWDPYRWGPVSDRRDVPGLVTAEGYFAATTEAVYGRTTLAELETEGRAQIRKALSAGIDVTHLDSHMGVLAAHWYNTGSPSKLDVASVYKKLAQEFALPVRMASQELLATRGAAGLREEFARVGIVFPDFLWPVDQQRPDEDRKAYWLRTIRDLRPGVSELFIHASLETDDMKRMTGRPGDGGWQERATEYELFGRDADIRTALEAVGVKRIGYRPLRDLQRGKRP